MFRRAGVRVRNNGVWVAGEVISFDTRLSHFDLRRP
jgi:hypothetical protein